MSMSKNYQILEIVSPGIPYVGAIKGGMYSGKIISLSGQIPADCTAFCINLQCGPQINPRSDVAFHFNPRFNQGYIARNSYMKQSWGKEEGDGVLPFSRGTTFEMRIHVLHDKYMLTINGSHHITYQHRIPPDQVTHVTIEGDVYIDSFRFHELMQDSFPPAYNSLNNPPMKVPFSRGIVMSNGTNIWIDAFVKKEPKNFVVNLMTGTPGDDIALHLNPRFNGFFSSFVLNSCSGSWHKEIYGNSFPFKAGEKFLLQIKCLKDIYSIMVNGKEVAEFKHRLHPDLVTKLFIDGDLSLNCVNVQ